MSLGQLSKLQSLFSSQDVWKLRGLEEGGGERRGHLAEEIRLAESGEKLQ